MNSWRKWIVRGVVYGIASLCALAALVYQRWTNPVAVREQVMVKLGKIFPGAHISLDSARLRIFGGIQINDLRLTRTDDPDKNEFFHVPSAILYHDKEKILDGELTFRKVELFKPRLRVRREADGTWNLARLTGKLNPNIPIPTLVVHQGAISFEDRGESAKLAALEVHDVSVTLINDPIATIAVSGSARSDPLGRLRWRGSLQRATGEVQMHVEAKDVPVTEDLVLRFAGSLRPEALAGLQLDLRTDVRADLAYRPAWTTPLSYAAHLDVRRGKVQHPKLPLPLDDLKAAIDVTGGEVRVTSLQARSGPAEIELQGVGQLDNLENEFETQIAIRHLPLCEELCARLPEKMRSLHKTYQAYGPTTVHLSVARQGGEWGHLHNGQPSQISLRPENLAVTFARFPYPLHKLTGTIDHNLLDRQVQIDLTGYAGDRPIFIKGHWQGEGVQADARFEIHGNDIAIDDVLLEALPSHVQKFSRSFHAQGKIDVKALIRHEPGIADYRNEFHVRFHDAEILWDDFPYPLKQVSGMLDVYPKHWEFHEFRGSHRGGQVLVHGKSIPKVDANGEPGFGVSVEINGREVPFDEDLRKALKPLAGLQKAYDTFQPQGRLSFTASVNRPSNQSKDLDISVEARGIAAQPQFFPYLFQEVNGHFRYQNNRLEIKKLRAQHKGASFGVEYGSVDLHPAGGFYCDLADLHSANLQLDEAFLSAIPGKLQEAARVVKLTSPVHLKTRLVVAQAADPAVPPDVFWDGALQLKDASLFTGIELQKVSGALACAGRYNGRQIVGIHGNVLLGQAQVLGQPFTNVQAQFQVRENAPDVMLIGLKAPIYDGDVAGQIRVDFNSTLRYELNLTASQIDLEKFGRHNLGNKTELKGKAVARLHLLGQGSGTDTLDGNGSIDIPHGHLYNLPILLDLLKFLGLHWPDRTAFEELHAQFAVTGRRVRMQRLLLLGNAVSLQGKGEFNLDGTDLQLDFFPSWTRVEPFLPPAVRPLPPAISKSLLTIEMRGRVGPDPNDIRFNKKLLPVVVDPLLLVRDRLVGATVQEKRN